jgi:hypothetical protein
MCYILCKCEKLYVGQTCRSTEFICKEHMTQFRLGQLERLAVAEHITYIGHRVKFSTIHRLARVNGCIDSVVKKAIEVQLHPNNFNRDNGFMLSKTWQPLLCHLCITAKHSEGQTHQSLDIAH